MADIAPHHIDQIGQAHRRLDGHDARLVKLEVQQKGEAVRAANIEQSLAEIRSDTRWLVRLIIGGIIAAIVAYALRGGFHV